MFIIIIILLIIYFASIGLLMSGIIPTPDGDKMTDGDKGYLIVMLSILFLSILMMWMSRVAV